MTKLPESSRKRVDIAVEKGGEELFPDILYKALSSSGIWIEEKDGNTIIKCYPADTDMFLDMLRRSSMEVKSISVVDEPQQDYAALTRKYFRPIVVAGITIMAPWNKTKRQGMRLVIDPGMAFGTGRHESTKMMLKLMGTIDMAGKEVLDVGCGSAILSLYAARLGARRVLAVDNDEDTVLSAFKNVDLNGISNIELICSDLQNVGGTYDVVLANIDIGTFRATANHVARLVNEGGYLIVSGILGRNRKELQDLFGGLSLRSTEQMRSWRGFVFQTVQR